MRFLIVATILMLQAFSAYALGDKPEKPAVKTSNVAEQAEAGIYNFRTISATYGMNCLGKPKINTLGIPSYDKKYQAIKADNALETIKSQCEGKQLCSFDVSPKLLKEDPAPQCAKELVITYRCYNIDVPHSEKFKDGEKVNISCRSPNAPPPAEEGK